MTSKHNKFTKLFKKIRPIDLLILCILMILLGSVYLLFKREVKMIQVRVKITDDNPLYADNIPSNQFAYAFTRGDSDKKIFGSYSAKILDVEAYRMNGFKQVVYLDMELEAIQNNSTGVYTYKGRPVVYGETHVFMLSNVKFKGMIVDFPGFLKDVEVKNGEKIVETQIRYENRNFSEVYGIPKYLANRIKVGDQVKDRNGKVWVEILDVTRKPAIRTVVANNGTVTQATDPELVDVYLKLKLKTRTINDKTYAFDMIPVEISETLPLNFHDYTLYPTIINIL